MKYLITFEKGESVRWLGHLDILRTFERAIRRADLPIAFTAGFNPRERSWNFTQPWPGGRWTLRDIVTYQTDAAYALLRHAAMNRDRWLANFLTVESRAVKTARLALICRYALPLPPS